MLRTQLLRTEIAIFLKDASFCICCFVFFCVSRFVRFFLCWCFVLFLLEARVVDSLKRNPSVQSNRTELKISHKIIVVKRGFESIVNSGLKNTVMIVTKCFAPRKKGLPSYEQQDQLAENLIQLKIQTEHKSIIHLNIFFKILLSIKRTRIIVIIIVIIIIYFGIHLFISPRTTSKTSRRSGRRSVKN